MRWLALLFPCLIAACDGAPAGAPAPLDYEEINEAARGPAIAVQLEALGEGALATERVSGAFCSLSRLNDPGPIIIATPEVAYAVIDGEPHTFAAYPGKSALAFEVAQHFDGRAYSLEIELADPSGAVREEGRFSADAMVLLRDPLKRLIHEGFATLDCVPAPSQPRA